MTQTKKILMGIGAFLPIIGSIVLMVVYFSFMMRMMESGMMQQQPPDPHRVFPEFIGIVKLIVCLGIPLTLISLTIMVLYIIHAVNNRALPDGERIVWIILFVLTGIIAFPIYFFMRIAGRQNEGSLVSLHDAVPDTY